MGLFIFLLLVILIIDVLVFAGLRPLFSKIIWKKRRGLILGYWTVSMIMFVVILLALLFRYQVPSYQMLALYYYAFTLFVIVMVAKIVLAVFIVCRWLLNAVLRMIGLKGSSLLYWIVPGSLIALILCGILSWGVIWGRFDFRVERIELSFENLPESFDGYTMVQISDLHLGSWWGVGGFLPRALKMAQLQKPDILFFTGDLVNIYADEITPYIPVLQQLSAPDGVFAVMGNHDYGRYFHWKNSKDSILNLQKIREGYADCGFRVLNNEAVFLVRGPDSIRLMGTENGSNLPFPQIAALPPEKVTNGDTIQMSDSLSIYNRYFHILLTHDPYFWSKHVVGKNIPLTLAGHSHGFQVQVKLGGRYWNPTARFYPFANGLYKEGNCLMYVNRGLGWIGFAGRLSVFPEITCIVLRKKR